MKKMNFISIVLILIFAFAIVPGVLSWLGLPTPSEAVAYAFTALLGEPSLVNNIISLGITAVIISLLILSIRKSSKKMEKSSS